MIDYTSDLLISQSIEIDELKKEKRKIKKYFFYIFILFLLTIIILIASSYISFNIGYQKGYEEAIKTSIQ